MKQIAHKIRSLILVLHKSGHKHERLLPRVDFEEKNKTFITSSVDNQMEAAIIFRDKNIFENNSKRGSGSCGSLILGDDCEFVETGGRECMANAVYIEYDLIKKRLKFMTSITGLPALFIYKAENLTVITSDIYLLTSIPGLDLHLDPEGIIEQVRIGHPIEHRTLIKDCKMVPSGSEVKINGNAEATVVKSWFLPEEKPMHSWENFITTQESLFKEAIDKIDLHNSFLSLTAGLDTRTILAVLLQKQVVIPSYTMSGEIATLDARIAKKLCKAFGYQHTIVRLDEDFTKDLPDYINKASLLSGGICSIDQASEVYFYKHIGNAFSSRISGNLGNQVGRRGSEKVSLRNVDTSVLNADFLKKYDVASMKHWYNEALTPQGGLRYDFLIEKEVPFSSVANYCVGQHFAIQQSPYSNSKLISFSNRVPKDGKSTVSPSLLSLKLKDLKHRFLGEDTSLSFQRHLIKQIGGYTSTCPINWGWRAKGGVSLYGMMEGMMAFLDALTHSKGLDAGAMGTILKKMNIQGMHQYQNYRVWMRRFLKDFLYDSLLSTRVKEGGVFKAEKIRVLLDDFYYKGQSNERMLMIILDIVLAQKNLNLNL